MGVRGVTLVLDKVFGCNSWEFYRSCILIRLPHTISLSTICNLGTRQVLFTWFRVLSKHKVDRMLEKYALGISSDRESAFHSRLFLVEKPSGGCTPRIDMYLLSFFCSVEQVQGGDWNFGLCLVMLLVDLKKSAWYLFFSPKETLYQWNAPCFGFYKAPQVFDRLFTLVLTWAHQWGIHLLRYLDSWLVLVKSVPIMLDLR